MNRKLKLVKSLVQELPGPKSYCNCERLCSPITIDHVVPKKILKQGMNFRESSVDPHNLYACCQKLNQEKASLVFGNHFMLNNDVSEHTGALARSSLYVYDRYRVPFDGKIRALWRQLHSIHEPKQFEYDRDDIIFEYTGTRNHYLNDYQFLDYDESEYEKKFWD